MFESQSYSKLTENPFIENGFFAKFVVKILGKSLGYIGFQ